MEEREKIQRKKWKDIKKGIIEYIKGEKENDKKTNRKKEKKWQLKVKLLVERELKRELYEGF